MSYSLSNLINEQQAADNYYGFPSGTLTALGQTESSNGTNLGSIGNVYQILPSTAANPGYGLSSLNGNSSFDAGAYLNALWKGPANGDLATAFAMYQGGAGNPTPYASGTPVSNFLNSLTGGTSTASTTNTSGSTTPFQSGGGTAAGNIGAGILNWLFGGGGPDPYNAASKPAPNWVLRLGVGAIAFVLFSIGVAALALRTEPTKIVQRAVSNVAP